MGFLGNLFHTLVPISNLFTKDKPKTDPYAQLMGQLQPLIDQQKQISSDAGKGGLSDVATARGDYDYVTNYLKKFLTGSDDEILKQFDVSGLTKNSDENEQQLSEQGVRGGARAAGLGQTSFDRDALINRMLQQIRQTAPDKIANIAQAIGNLGTNELSASLGGSSGASSILFGVEGLRQADADRRTQLIGSIFEAIGGAAGALACLGLDSKIEGWDGTIILRDLKKGDIVASYDEKGNKISRTVIRTRETPKQLVYNLPNDLQATPTHVFYTAKLEEVAAKNLATLGTDIVDVKIFKLDDEISNYSFKANGFLSCDDDCLVKE